MRPVRSLPLVITMSLGALLALSPCHAEKVKVHVQGDVDLSELRTFEVISRPLEETEGPLGELMFPRLHATTDGLMERKGFEPSDDPDFLIAFQGEIIDHLDIAGGYQQHVGEHYVVESWSPGYRISTYDELFAVIMWLPGEDEPFWVASEIIGLGHRSDPEAATDRAEKALRKILKHFPP